MLPKNNHLIILARFSAADLINSEFSELKSNLYNFSRLSVKVGAMFPSK